MSHDFQKLNIFESATIGMMVVGIVLVGVIFFYALPENRQINIKKSVAFLDVHEQTGKPLKTVQSVLETPALYLDEFYLAFTQTLSLPVDMEIVAANVDSVGQDFGLLADYFGGIYESQYSSRNNYGNAAKVATGRVLGVSYQIKDEREEIKDNKEQIAGNKYQTYSNLSNIFDLSVIKQKIEQYFSKLINSSP